MNPDAHVSTKIEYNHILQGGSGGIAPGSQRNVKNGCLNSFHVMMWIQIRAWGSGGMLPEFFFIKMVQAGAI